jgi:hypothetical protein
VHRAEREEVAAAIGEALNSEHNAILCKAVEEHQRTHSWEERFLLDREQRYADVAAGG